MAKDVPADYERFDDKAIRARFPYLDPPPDLQGRYQSSIGDYINPRSLVRAQKKIAESQGVPDDTGSGGEALDELGRK